MRMLVVEYEPTLNRQLLSSNQCAGMDVPT